MTVLCQACERRPSSLGERADDPDEPYLVCQQCHVRLMSRSLRPLEWFNLAKRHGWAKFLLHDDFYDDDGEASQPEEDVEQPYLYPAPNLRQVQQSPDALLGYSITRWQLDDELRAAWLRLPAEGVLACLSDRFDSTRNLSVRSVVLQVAALIGTEGAPVTRRAWQASPDYRLLRSLAEATAACLPLDEGFKLVVDALDAMPERERRQLFGALSHFRSTMALDWIETHASEPSVDAWGYLAAASGFSWSKADAWFKAGRPLSLIAIDALLAIARPRTPFLRQIRPALGNPPSERALRNAIETLMQTDPVPRVKQRTAALLELAPALISGHACPR